LHPDSKLVEKLPNIRRVMCTTAILRHKDLTPLSSPAMRFSILYMKVKDREADQLIEKRKTAVTAVFAWIPAFENYPNMRIWPVLY